MIRRDPFQTTDGHGFDLDPTAPAGGLTRAVANSPENAGGHVFSAIHHVGVGEPTLGNQPNVLRDIGMRGAGPLAVDHPMKIVRFPGIGRFHVSSYSDRAAEP